MLLKLFQKLIHIHFTFKYCEYFKNQEEKHVLLFLQKVNEMYQLQIWGQNFALHKKTFPSLNQMTIQKFSKMFFQLVLMMYKTEQANTD